MFIHVQVSDVKWQGEAGDEHKPLGPKQGVKRRVHVQGCGGGPNPSDERHFQPHHLPQSPVETGDHGIGQGSEAQNGHSRQAFGSAPLEFVKKTKVERDPENAPSPQHLPTAIVPETLTLRGHVLGVLCMFDGPLNAVAQTR